MQSERHPDELELELFRTGEADTSVADHIVACDACMQRVSDSHRLAELLAPALAPPESPAIEVPTEVDLALRRAARRAAARGWSRRYWLAGAAAICAAAIAFVVLRPGPQSPSSRVVTAAGPSDVNGDGVIDILDAFALARTLERGDEPRPEWDINGDRAIDRSDVDAIAAQAVAAREQEHGARADE